MINAGTASTGLVALQSAFVNVNLAEETSVAGAAQALVLVLDLVNDAVGLVLAQTDWAHWWGPALWHAVADGGVEEGAWRAWHSLEHIDVSADYVRFGV